MTNLEFYKEEIISKLYGGNSLNKVVSDLFWEHHYSESQADTSLRCILDWLCEEYQILDKKEKEYLSAVIKPFRDRKVCLCKLEDNNTNDQFEMICINFKQLDDKRYGHFLLPFFKKSTMYKGMKPYINYTLEELGL